MWFDLKYLQTELSRAGQKNLARAEILRTERRKVRAMTKNYNVLTFSSFSPPILVKLPCKPPMIYAVYLVTQEGFAITRSRGQLVIKPKITIPEFSRR